MKQELESARLDKWLWAVRLYKTRTQAAEACRLSRVRIDNHEVKPSREVKIGDVFTVQLQDMTRTVKVTALLRQRVGAKLVAGYLEDLTPASEIEAARQRRENQLHAPPVHPLFKPSKRDRRILTEFFNRQEDRPEI